MMPSCSQCGKTQTKLDVNDLCKHCRNNESVSSQNSSDYADLNDDTLLSQITVEVFKEIIKKQLESIEKKVTNIETSLNSKVKILESKILVLENELQNEKEKNEKMSNVIINMQSSLNSIDSASREKNVIISGLPETDLNSNGKTLSTDKQKMSFIAENINAGFNYHDIKNFTLTRIGQPNANKPRILKVKLGNKANRDKLIQASSRLKNLGEPWKKVFINYDNHPVYQRERNRLRLRMNELRKSDEYADNPTERVKIVKGELKVDDATIDRNFFLH